MHLRALKGEVTVFCQIVSILRTTRKLISQVSMGTVTPEMVTWVAKLRDLTSCFPKRDRVAIISG